ncbi:hypothetical protein BDN72DRAFT_762326 [Pluteus cervinus]|uniref:Uncharacterized protein n=1 Tax=Pluteus cervinus TaxID=181527 RepID=A0ACD3B5J3_9AGAR|nr:hypothetical protein BDN72DRAFT_762326 [Pluteus cervinus]
MADNIPKKLSPPPAGRRTSLLDLINTDDNNNNSHAAHFDRSTTVNNNDHNFSSATASHNARSTPNPISISGLLNNTDSHSPSGSGSASDPQPPQQQQPLAPPPSLPSSKPASTVKPSSTRTSTKPRSTKAAKARSPSPSPPPPTPAQPLTTIRLDIPLQGPEKYEIDISSLSKETGQRPPTPVPVKRDTSESEGEGEDEQDKNEEADGKKSKKRKVTAEYYDISDPFIDDSELEVDQRKYFAQTKQQGFYVSSGEVALLKDNKPAKKHLLADSGPSSGQSTSHKPAKGEGTKDSPITLTGDEDRSRAGKGDANMDGDGNEQSGDKRKRYQIIQDPNGKRRKIINTDSYPKELRDAIEEIKAAIAKEDWTQKGKFPQNLKPLLSDLALKAIKNNEYDEQFFTLMPQLFPYNKFTMSKLIKRTVYPDHHALLIQRQDALLEELKKEAEQGFAKAEEEWEKSVVAWDKRQEKARAEAATSTPADPTDSTAPTRHGTEEMDVDHPIHDSGSGVGDNNRQKNNTRDQHPPAKKYRMTEKLKGIVWDLVLLSNECCRLENEKNTLEGSVLQVSEQGLRKVLYQKIVAAFPEGWMSSGQISRDVSAMKKKFEKEAMDEGA